MCGLTGAVFHSRHDYHSLGFRVVSGSAGAAEPLPQALPLQPDEGLEAADVQMLADSLWAHSAMNHSDRLVAEGTSSVGILPWRGSVQVTAGMSRPIPTY